MYICIFIFLALPSLHRCWNIHLNLLQQDFRESQVNRIIRFSFSSSAQASHVPNSRNLNMATIGVNENSIRTLLDEIITVEVGKERVAFKVHRKLLCSKSSYFAAAYKNCWMADSSKVMGTVALAQDSPTVFSIFQTYLYQGVLRESDFTKEEFDSNNIFIPECIVLGDKIGCTGFQNAAIDHYYRCLVGNEWSGKTLRIKFRPASLDVIRYIYSSTLPGAPLRKMLCYVFADNGFRKGKIEATLKFLQDCPANFLHELLRLLSEATCGFEDMWGRRESSSCQFHLHEDGKKCPQNQDQVRNLVHVEYL